MIVKYSFYMVDLWLMDSLCKGEILGRIKFYISKRDIVKGIGNCRKFEGGL